MAKKRTGEELWFSRPHEDSQEIEIRWHLKFDDGTDHAYSKRGLKIPYHLMPFAISYMQKMYRYISARQAQALRDSQNAMKR